MNENEIIAAVCTYLESTGCQITSRLSTSERGIDITANHDRRSFYIEAKGGTSSRKGSNRFGKPYTQSQVFDRVAKGFFTAACLRNKYGEESVVGLAFPDTPLFRRYVDDVALLSDRLHLTFYWVKADKTVLEEKL